MRYVDDPFEDNFNPLPSSDFQKWFLGAVGRKKYSSKSERKKVEGIEKRMLSGKLPRPYVTQLIHWAENKTIPLSRLISAINKKDNLRVFLAEHKEYQVEDRGGYE